LQEHFKLVQNKLSNHINNTFSFLQEKKLLIACSGGLDSVVLSRLLKELGFAISLAHCNFSLRGNESDGDENFVVKLANKLSVPVFTKTFNTKEYAEEQKISTQMAARDLRYHWFEELIKNHSYDYLLTAHHLDDDLETFFINLSRGTGLTGLTGIPAINNKTIRPLLAFSRDEILIYATNKNIDWREDSSNIKTDYLRNNIRLNVIPKYKEVKENVLRNFKKTINHLQESQNLVNDYMSLLSNLLLKKTSEGISIDINKLIGLPNVKAILYQLLSRYGFTQWNDIFDLLEAQSGKKVFSETHLLLKNRDTLLLSEIDTEESTIFYLSENDLEISFPIRLSIEKALKITDTSKNILYLDKEKIIFPLKLRKWEHGDYFYPFGMKGKKKLSKFFKDEKLSLVTKKKIWVLCSGHKIIWVVGMRPDNRFIISTETQEILKITYKN